MTNEEKAFELSSMNRYGFSVEESNAAYNAAIEMAEWKDRIFEKIIDVVIEKFNQYPDNAAFRKSNVIDMLIEIKKAMEE